MNLAGQRQLLDDFYQSVVGLRKGETGRANAHINALAKRLSGQLPLMSTDNQQRALPVIRRMLKAKEHNDLIGLADIIEYELPYVLEESEFSPALLSIDIIRRLTGTTANANEKNRGIEAAGTVVEIYAQNDGVAGIGSYFAAQHYLDGRYTEARRLLDLDDSVGRRTPAGAYLLALLRAREANLSEADALMSWAYSNAAALRDGFTEIAWICHERGRYAEAMAYVGRDEKQARLSPPTEAKAALIFGASGKTAEAVRMIDHAYAADPELRDAYAALGWQSYEKLEWETADRVIGQDLAQNRLSPMYQCYLAMIRARLGQWDNAQALVNHAYANDADVKDGYGRIGWAGFLMGLGIPFFNAQLEKDRSLKRDAITGRFFNAVLLTAKGELAEAVADTEHAYIEHPGERNWLSVLGWQVFRSGQIQRGCELFDKDYTLGRMNQAMIPSYAVILSASDRRGEALKMLDGYMTATGPDDRVFLGFRLRPDATMELSRLRELVRDRATFAHILDSFEHQR